MFTLKITIDTKIVYSLRRFILYHNNRIVLMGRSLGGQNKKGKFPDLNIYLAKFDLVELIVVSSNLKF